MELHSQRGAVAHKAAGAPDPIPRGTKTGSKYVWLSGNKKLVVASATKSDKDYGALEDPLSVDRAWSVGKGVLGEFRLNVHIAGKASARCGVALSTGCCCQKSSRCII